MVELRKTFRAPGFGAKGLRYSQAVLVAAIMALSEHDSLFFDNSSTTTIYLETGCDSSPSSASEDSLVLKMMSD